ncbi:hypothetical protein [Streptomyces sp. PTY087I2]|uniref:hypothetical protein n=1 Tax=Streptomyces sp. PTY087I2 TaxID=1819298 RepID=UPI00080B4D75|nr:hypothetical protein [Streptomyces sp. PTY087I2]OCC07820.1 hypothetical protein A3Q37_06413 [Streptomyces sp. PTY087I2]
MRQFPAPVRWAAVTALTIAASTGCMSVGEDGAGGPGPSRSAGSKGSEADPAGDTVPGSGQPGGRGGGAHPHSDRGIPGSTPSPGASGAAPSATAEDARPEPATSGQPTRGGGGARPTPTPSTPGPGEPPPVTPEPPAPPTSAPDPDPEPEPTDPPEPPPSASPAAQYRAQGMGGPEKAGPLRTPEASPQVGPV